MSEQFADCGSKVVLRGLRGPGTLTLVETNETSSRNALRFFAAVFGVFTLCGVAPIAILIGLVVRRARRKGRGGEAPHPR